jgi:anti-anti-sigma factor
MARFRTFNTSGVAVLAIGGEFDGAGVEEFLAVRDIAIQRDLPLLLDLSECEFIDSTGIGCVVRTFQRIQQRGQRFALVGSSPKVRRTLEVVGFFPRIPDFPQLHEAIVGVTHPPREHR